ncbi:MAG: DNA replication/repair protein RecF [Myxococcota bacterium]
MRLQRVRVAGFRNLAPATIEVDAPLVAFVGDNGQGKTNWLEAVGVLGTLKSFRTAKPAETIAWGEARAEVDAVGVSDGMTRTWRWAFADGARAIRRDDRNVDAVAWLQSLRATFFVPGDVAPVRGEPALRRALLERAVLTVRPGYLADARDLRRVLEHKAALLRAGGDDTQLDVIDEQLVRVSEAVTRARADTVACMEGPFGEHYAAITDGEPAGVRYRPWMKGGADEMLAWLRGHRAEERAAGRVLGGPQRDDLELTVLGRAARAYASQGQARSLVLAWKLAELDAARAGDETPLFLLDDLGSELDPSRTTRLVARVRSLGAQVFVTTTDARLVPEREGARLFRVARGVATPG